MQLPSPPRSWNQHLASLPNALGNSLGELPAETPEAAVKILTEAVEDYVHLRELITDNALTEASVGERTLVEAEQVLEALIGHAEEIASHPTRSQERKADHGLANDTQSTFLKTMRAKGDVLHEVSSAAILFAASLSDDDASSLQRQTEELRLLVAADAALTPRKNS